MRPARIGGHPKDVLGFVFVRVLGIGPAAVALTGEELGVVFGKAIRDVFEEDEAEYDVLRLMLLWSLSADCQSLASKPKFSAESVGAELALGVRGMKGFREIAGWMAAIKAPGGTSGKVFNPRRRGNFPETRGSFCGR